MKKTTMITVPVFWSGNAFWKTVEVALKKLLGGCVCVCVGGGGRGGLPRLLTTSTR